MARKIMLQESVVEQNVRVRRERPVFLADKKLKFVCNPAKVCHSRDNVRSVEVGLKRKCEILGFLHRYLKDIAFRI